MKSVLILSQSDDIHSDIVENNLSEKKISVLRINTDKLEEDEVLFDLSIDKRESSVFLKRKRYKLSSISSVWYRRPRQPQMLIPDLDQKKFAEDEMGELLLNFYFHLNHAQWVSALPCLEKARRKLPQLLAAKRVGLRVPRTCVTNFPERVRSFYHKCGKKIVYKTLKRPVLGKIQSVPTSLLTKDHIDQIDSIKYSGGIFQEYIEKEYEIRVTVIGGKLFAVKIDSQISDESKIDWRESVALEKVPITAIRLPSKIESKCMTLVKNYGISFGAIDLIYAPNGDYVFLEINPNGQWYWVEYFTRLPLTESIVELLTSRW